MAPMLSHGVEQRSQGPTAENDQHERHGQSEIGGDPGAGERRVDDAEQERYERESDGRLPP
jgi:hypothetical protein